jgi:hypothetical protein
MSDVDKIARRPNEYLFETGVPQFTSGLVFSLLGASTLIRSHIHLNFALDMTITLGAFALCGFAFWFARRVKQRAVFPRGGYVVVQRPRANRIALGIFLILSLLMLVRALMFYPPPRMDSRLIWPGFAIAFALFCVGEGWQQKSSFMILFGIYFSLLAPLLWWLPADNYERSGAMQAAAGIPLAIFGALRLRKYLKLNTPAEPIDE